jgi:hypothetical protein
VGAATSAFVNVGRNMANENQNIIGAGQDTAHRAPKDIRVLIACEESQTVCIEFRKLGFDAYSCDIQPCSGGHPEWHIQGDVLPVLAQHWDLIVAHPPCTFLSHAGARWLYPKGVLSPFRHYKGKRAAEFFFLFLNLQCKHVAIENPVPSAIFGLPPHQQVIQPWQFGNEAQKKTLLWLKKLPPLVPTCVVGKGEMVTYKSGKRKAKWFMDAARSATPEERAKKRSVTFPGIAKAMAEQWGAHVLCEESPAQNTMEICHTAPNTPKPTEASIAEEPQLRLW